MCVNVSIHDAFSTDPDERDGSIGGLQGRQRAGDEGRRRRRRRPSWGIREGVHAPLQRRAAEPERAAPPQHPDRRHPGCRQRATAGALRCARGLQVGAQHGPSVAKYCALNELLSDPCRFQKSSLSFSFSFMTQPFVVRLSQLGFFLVILCVAFSLHVFLLSI